MFYGYLAAMALATLVGVSLGLLGGGGSIITTPVLVYVAHIPPERAVVMSLVIVGSTSLVGAILHLRQGHVALKPVVVFAVSGMVGSYLGSTGTHLLSQRNLMLLFSAIMLIVGGVMLRKRPSGGPSKAFSTCPCLGAGFAVGVLNGFLGIGGGFLIVPALVLFAGLDSRMAAGTALPVIAFNSASAVIGQLRFVPIDWGLLAGFLVFAFTGMVAGSMLSGRLPDAQLRRIFAVMVLVLGVAIGFENLR